MLKPVLAGFEKKISKIKIEIEKTSVGRLLSFDLNINLGIENYHAVTEFLITG
jgi:hypothetical protein